MKKLFFALSLLLVAQSCRANDVTAQVNELKVSLEIKAKGTQKKSFITTDSINYIPLFRQTDSTKTYSQIKALVLKERDKVDLKTISYDSLNRLFTDLLVYKIIPYWYGTTWAFEGYTAIPNKGEIACGYFVSTTLLHMGININRYKMAQQLPKHEALTVCVDERLVEIENASVEENIAQLDLLLTEGIYFLGFDQSHVGYILKKHNQLFVIHANYIGDGGVTVEKIYESRAFASFRKFYVAPISTNKKLMRKWVLGEVVTVIYQ